MASPHPPNEPARILIRGVNWLGDAVMTTPALLRLRDRFPGARTTLLCPAKLADLWMPHPAIDEVQSFAAGEGAWTISRRLREQRFDLALLLPNSPRTGLEVFLARIPRRVGVRWPWRNWLLTEVVSPAPGMVRMRKRGTREIKQVGQSSSAPRNWGDPPPATDAHQLFHYLHLAAHLGADPTPLPPALGVLPGEVEAARRRFGLDPARRWLGINPGAEYGPAKRWPAAYFSAVARHALSRPGWGVAAFGGPSDTKVVAEVLNQLGDRHLPVLNLAGRTSLREMAAAFAACTAVVTNDTGPMHVAAAVGTRVVALFGSTSPELTGPGLPGEPRHRLLKSDAACSPCFLRECPIDFRCLRDLRPEAALQALEPVFEM